MKPNATGHKCISYKRDKDGEIIGYQVAVQWRNRKLYEWVPITTTRDEALDHALYLRSDFEQQLGKPRTEHFIIGTAEGVTRHDRATVDGGPSWQAYIEVDGQKLATSFSVGDHGEEGARKKARTWRRQKEVEFFGRTFTPA